MAVSKKNFFKDHYDWLVAIVGILLLVGVGFLFVTSLEDSPEKVRRDYESKLAQRKPDHKNVPSADEIFSKLDKALVPPSKIPPPDKAEGSFLSSEHRKFCVKCRYPLPYDCKVCLECKQLQPSKDLADDNVGGTDMDKDGMPDAWEQKYGFNPNDSADAKQDLDGDTFTNLEEYEAKTDPKDPDSHPDFLDSLSVSGQLKVEALKFWFDRADATSSSPKDSDWRITFLLQNDFAKEKGLNPKVPVMVGKEIVFQSSKAKIVKGRMIYEDVPSGWRVVKYNKDEKLVAVQGSEQKKMRDVSTVDLERISDKRTLSLQVKNRKPVAVEEQIDLQWSRGEGQTITVTTGTKFKLKDREYEVKKLVKEGNACKVIVMDLKTKKEKPIQ